MIQQKNFLKWHFEKYGEESTRQDSSSEKFFKDAPESDSLIREFIQNSLDAASGAGPVRAVISEKILSKKSARLVFEGLKPHLQACGIQAEDQAPRFIVLEDFNTKGLEGGHKQKFFLADNITGKTAGGGSHGIGKAVFPAASKTNAFLGYSVFEGRQGLVQIFQGRAILKTHKINGAECRPYGSLEIPAEENESLISSLFVRGKSEKGLSAAIPYCDISIESLKESCLRQFYLPIIWGRLEIEIGSGKIDKNTLLDMDGELKARLAGEYETAPRRSFSVKESFWKEGRLPPALEKELSIESQNQALRFSFKIEMPVKQGPPEHGEAVALIKKEELDQPQAADFWRDNLLITKAAGSGRREREYSAIAVISENPLSRLLRRLEDPGHTRWQTGSLPDDLKAKYKNIPKLVRFIKKLPQNIIRQMKRQSASRDSRFFSDYFPESSPSGKSPGGEGRGGRQSGGAAGPEILEAGLPDFAYSKHKKGDGFTLKLKKTEDPPGRIIIKTAYGTNIGDAFRHYDKRDFALGANIKVDAESGERVSCDGNRAEYLIQNEKFRISFSGFNPDKELKIDIQTKEA